MAITDEDLVYLAKRELPHTTQAYAELVKRHSKYVFQIAFGITNDNGAAEDVAQDVFVTVFDKLHGFEERSTFKTWITTITTRRSLTWLQKRKTDHLDIDEVIESSPELASDNCATEGRLYQQLTSKLSEGEREIVTLRFVADLEFSEIAELLDEKLSAIKMRFYRAVEKMKTDSDV